MKPIKAILFMGLFALLASGQARATVIVTYAEQPGVEKTSLANTATYDFNSLPLGLNKNVTWAGVGTFNQLNILSADSYGGAAGSDYAVEGLSGANAVQASTLTLNTPSSYFGLWWSAGDASNVLDFYSGANGTGTLLAEFTTKNLMKMLPKAYYGNPNPGWYSGQDAGEPFAFINFFGDSTTQWSSVVLRNSSASGFEADNFASRVQAYNPSTDGQMPGVVLESINGTQETLAAPEPPVFLAMLIISGASFGPSVLRRLKIEV